MGVCPYYKYGYWNGIHYYYAHDCVNNTYVTATSNQNLSLSGNCSNPPTSCPAMIGLMFADKKKRSKITTVAHGHQFAAKLTAYVRPRNRKSTAPPKPKGDSIANAGKFKYLDTTTASIELDEEFLLLGYFRIRVLKLRILSPPVGSNGIAYVGQQIRKTELDPVDPMGTISLIETYDDDGDANTKTSQWHLMRITVNEFGHNVVKDVHVHTFEKLGDTG